MAVARIGRARPGRFPLCPGRSPVLVAIDRAVDLVGAGHRHIGALVNGDLVKLSGDVILVISFISIK